MLDEQFLSFVNGLQCGIGDTPAGISKIDEYGVTQRVGVTVRRNLETNPVILRGPRGYIRFKNPRVGRPISMPSACRVIIRKSLEELDVAELIQIRRWTEAPLLRRFAFPWSDSLFATSGGQLLPKRRPPVGESNTVRLHRCRPCGRGSRNRAI